MKKSKLQTSSRKDKSSKKEIIECRSPARIDGNDGVKKCHTDVHNGLANRHRYIDQSDIKSGQKSINGDKNSSCCYEHHSMQLFTNPKYEHIRPKYLNIDFTPKNQRRIEITADLKTSSNLRHSSNRKSKLMNSPACLKMQMPRL